MGLLIFKDFVEIDKRTVQILTNNGFLNNIHLSSDDGPTYIIGNSIIHTYKTESVVEDKTLVTQHIYSLNPMYQLDCHITYNKETKDITAVATNFTQGEQDIMIDSIQTYLRLKVFKIGESWRDMKYEN